MSLRIPLLLLLAGIGLLAALACTPGAGTPGAPGAGAGAGPTNVPATPKAVQTTNNLWAYCRAVGTIDEPGPEYTGPAVPPEVARGLAQEFLSTQTPTAEQIGSFLQGTTVRCMNGEVYACNVGANIPCMGKANTSRTPNETMVTYCQQNPNSDFIPAVAAGRETVYEWSCQGTTPTAGRQTLNADPQGFISEFWYQIPQPTA